MTTEDGIFSHSGAADYMASEDYSYRYEPQETRVAEPEGDPVIDFTAPSRSNVGTIGNLELSTEDTLFGPTFPTLKR